MGKTYDDCAALSKMYRDWRPEDRTGWRKRHAQAVNAQRGASMHEQAIRELLYGFLRYADAHRSQFADCEDQGDTPFEAIGNDYFLGQAWARIGKGLLELLNGETGRFDCGSLDSVIRNALEGAGTD